MNCRDVGELVHAYVDDELDIVTARQLDLHLRECSHCKDSLESVRAVRTAVSNPAQYYKAPPELRVRVLAATRALSANAVHLPSLPTAFGSEAQARRGEGRGEGNLEEGRSTYALTPTLSRRQARSPQIWWGVAVAAAAMIVLAFGLFFTLQGQRGNPVVAEVLTAHLRSLQPGHLMDVVSTNQHTVKPWFDTHIDFSPPVRQLAPDFPLVGGRLDYLENRPVAVLIYKHGDHLINLFIWPGDSGQSFAAQRGFNFVHWTSDGMTFWAVSDLAGPDLNRFSQLFQSAPAPATRN
ncbi:MAG TPA: anti-sigma factor [Tepidisphaeraceae bacterium]|nr:anti-sigma factor [Tepidisphaeraceae bacterium]